MATRSRPYEQFGPFILFRKLDSSALGELWRAARIEGQQLSTLLALHRLSGGNRAALQKSCEAARPILPSITGSTIVRSQMIEIIDGVPVLVHEYASGRSLRHIIDRARGGPNATANPIPTDQALAIAEKVALSVETINNMKYQGARLIHGALIPQFVWISDDGEIRTAGQQLGKGITTSLRVPEVAEQLAPYAAPEVRESSNPTKASDVYSVGAILYLVLTGSEPPDPTQPDFQEKLAAARLMAGGALIPPDIHQILDKAMAADPEKRFDSAANLRQALSPLLHGGNYSATTFNLAFYLSNLLRKEMDGETVEREKESKISLAPYLDATGPVAALAPRNDAESVPSFGADTARKRSKVPLYAGGIAAVVIAGAAIAYFATRGPSPQPKPAPAAPHPGVAAASKPAIEPIVESVTTKNAGTSKSATSTDPEAQKKAFEDAVNKKLKEEMLKLQGDYNQQLQNEGKVAASTTTPAPSQAAAPATTRDERPAMSASQLDSERRQAQNPAPGSAAVPPTATSATAPPPAPTQQALAVPLAAVPVASHVSEGDLISMNDLDVAPKVIRRVKPIYPPIAASQHAEGDVIVSVEVSPTGKVENIRVLRGDPRHLGLDEAAVQAVRGWTFTPPMKDGKAVRTWMPLGINFKAE